MAWWPVPPTLPLFTIAYALLAAERLLELAINRRNTRLLAQRGAVWTTDDGLRAIIAVQAALFLLTPLEVLLAPWAGAGWWTWPLLAVAILAQALRYWVISTLGERWSIRVVTVPGAPRILRGPYRFARHPNYVAVATEALVIPLAFGAIGAALVTFPLQLVALRRRIRKEERALRAAQDGMPPSPDLAAGRRRSA